MCTSVNFLCGFHRPREFWIEIILAKAVLSQLAIFNVKRFTMLNLLKLVSEFIFMSALTDCIVRCFIKVLFALFTAVTFSVQQFTTLVYRVIIVPIFIFVGADARFCARSHIERVPAIFMEVTISKWQVLTELHNFIISSHLFDVSASRGKVTGRSRCYIKFLVEDIIFIMYEMFIYNLSSQIYFSFII